MKQQAIIPVHINQLQKFIEIDLKPLQGLKPEAITEHRGNSLHRLEIEIDLKPLQGLKRVINIYRVTVPRIGIDLKPLQGLKQKLQAHGEAETTRSSESTSNPYRD